MWALGILDRAAGVRTGPALKGLAILEVWCHNCQDEDSLVLRLWSSREYGRVDKDDDDEERDSEGEAAEECDGEALPEDAVLLENLSRGDNGSVAADEDEEFDKCLRRLRSVSMLMLSLVRGIGAGKAEPWGYREERGLLVLLWLT